MNWFQTRFFSLIAMATLSTSMAWAQSGINCASLDKESLMDYAATYLGVDCAGAADAAESSCGGGNQMDPSALSAMMGSGSKLSQNMGGPMGIAQACKSEAGMHKMAMMINGITQASCSAAVGACHASCEISDGELNAAMSKGAIDETCALRIRSTFKTYAKKCEQHSAKAGQAMTQMMMSAMQAKMAEQCVQQAVAKNAELVEFCKRNPRNAQCANAYVDCMNPDMARTHPKCLCQDPTMAATHPVCSPNGTTGMAPGTQVGSFSSGAADGKGARRLSPTALEGLLGGEPEITAVKGNGNQGLASSGLMGGAGSSGGPKLQTSGGGPSQRGGRYKGPFDTDILKGMTNAKGGLFAGGGGGGLGGLNFGLKNDEEKKDKLDLRQFIPKDDPMGLRGVAAIAQQDGITGALGPSIWEKLSRRYKEVQPFLEP